MPGSSSRSKYRWRGYGAMLVSAVALVGCTGYSANPPMPGNAATEGITTAAAKDALRSDGNFTGALGQEYYTLAGARAQDKDWTDADYFARKSLAASKGDVVPPEDNRNWGVPGQADLATRDEMEQQRLRLLRALDEGGRNTYPKLAARAQARYDCWVERSEANYTTNFRGDCRRQYNSDVSDLEVLLHPPGPYHAYFSFNGKSLGPEAQQEIKQAASRIPQDGTARVKIVGWADRAGSDNYNAKLSDDRVSAVRAALVADGMAADRIDAQAKGERDVPVPTKDGAREPKNRVVEIRTEVPVQVASGSSSR
jgi:OmpA-OmpF porin, OOP family